MVLSKFNLVLVNFNECCDYIIEVFKWLFMYVIMLGEVVGFGFGFNVNVYSVLFGLLVVIVFDLVF